MRLRTRMIPFANFEGLETQEALWHNDMQCDDAPCVDSLVRDAIASTLTERQRRMVEMFFFEGLSQGEIAREMGVSQQVVHKCLHGDTRDGRVVGGALPRLRQALATVFADRMQS